MGAVDTRADAYEAAVLELKAIAPEEAAEFYERRVFGLSLALMRADAQPCVQLVLTAGSQPYSIALSLTRSPAQRVLIIHTDQSLASANQGLALAGRSAAGVSYRPVEKTDSSAVYRAIRDAVGSDRDGVVIDFTSGTKAMTAAASTAAGYLGVTQIYIESSPLWKDARFFGRERAHVVDHPLLVFGDSRREEAERLYARGAYEAAEAIFRELHRSRVPDFHYEARALLCVGYRELEALRFGEAAEALEGAAELLRTTPRRNLQREPLASRGAILASQAENIRALGALGGKASAAPRDGVLANRVSRFLLSYARRRLPTEADLASLLYYRAIELGLQRRLAVHGLDASKFEPASDDFWAQYDRVCEPAHRLGIGPKPSVLGLAQAYTCLRALGDSVVLAAFSKPIELLGQVQARNESLFAHGYRTLVGERAAHFGEKALHLARAVAVADGCLIPEPDPDFDPIELT